MRAPGVSGGDDELFRAVLDGFAIAAVVGLGEGDGRLIFVANEFANLNAVVQRDFLFGEQALESEIGRVARAGGADGTRVAADALIAAAVGHGVFRLRRSPERDVAFV